MRRLAATLLQPLAHSRVQIGKRQLERRSVAGCWRENPDDNSVERERVPAAADRLDPCFDGIHDCGTNLQRLGIRSEWTAKEGLHFQKSTPQLRESHGRVYRSFI